MSTDEIREILVKRVDQQKQAVGIVVGVIEPDGHRIVAYGHLANGDLRTLDGDTIFEIGSVTKVFTSLLLADMVNRREVTLDDRAAKYLPGNVKMPERSGNRLRCTISPRTLPGSQAFPATSSRRITAWMICTSSFPATRCRATPVPNSNIRTWARGCSATCSPIAPVPTLRT